MSKTCGTCANYDREATPLRKFAKDWRPCRGSTPTVELASVFGFARGIFPLMPEDGWCGLHKPVAPPPPAVGVRLGKPEVV